MVQVDIKNGKNYSFILNLLKTGTYAVVGFIGTYTVEAIQGGANFNNAIVIGVGMGVVAGIKNFIKHRFNVDLDLTKLKKVE